MTNDNSLNQYQALKHGCGYVELDNWTLLELSGADRKKFVHNFCTADVNGLQDNHTTEAFVLNGKGKILGHVHLVALPDRLLMVGAGDQAAALIEHLDRYIIRDDVAIKDLRAETKFMFVAGEKSSAAVKKAFDVELDFGRAKAFTGESNIAFDVLHAEIAGAGFLFVASGDCYASVSETLKKCADAECASDVLEAIRLENRTPWFGREIDETNLPQEIERDEKAISFNKGCYLGQETVARIDALGQVNRLLRFANLPLADPIDPKGTAGLRDAPPIGDEIYASGAVVGKVLSAIKIPGTSDALLGTIIKRSASGSGAEITIGSRVAHIL